MKKTYYTISNDSGGVAVIDVERYENIILDLRRLADECEISAKGKESEELLRTRAGTMEKYLDDLKSKGDQQTFEITAFKRKDRIRAKKNATTWDGDVPRLDVDAYETNLIALSTGKSVAEIEDMPDNLAQAVYDAVLQAAYPTPEIVTAHRFLSAGSGEATPSED